MRRRWIVLGLLIAAIGATAALAFILRGENGSATGQGLVLAKRACSEMGVVIDQVTRNERSDRVLKSLGSAAAAASSAADRDPLWRPLAGAVDAVRLALEEDDPDAARVGLSVVAAQCDRAGVLLGG